MNVEGVDIKKVDQKLVMRSAKKFKVPTNGTLASTVKALKAKLDDSDGQLSDCTVCGGTWPAELDACPFCGDVEREESVTGAERSDADSSPESSVIGGTASEEPPETSTALAQVERAPLASLAGNPGVVAPQKEEDLDKAVAVINTAKEKGAHCFSIVLMTLKRIVDTNLWKARTTDGGDPPYTSWTDFANKELDFSRTYAERLLKTANEFGSQPKLIEELGVNKLIVVLAAPKDQREKLLDKAKAGASRAKLQQITKELNEGTGRIGTGRGKKKDPPKVEVSKDEITLAVLQNKRQTIPLWSPKADKKGDFTTPAKKLDEQPHGWLVLPNGTRLIFQLLRMLSGQLKLVMTAKREA
jgi:hypothetical protein